ncbi:hypothetical protein [Ancylobacter oerskovii]|uniref:Uncharacterized protein n=1 Tax=Ancylobacter oerskovii TaxID=459519 RepID=A0ABW4Z3R6_9HYPH|nr:hypothetical protein [Ancylobacter oerskovii]MBS7546276.1 hypothetical protein [Ancylobacter oerskovii]
MTNEELEKEISLLRQAVYSLLHYVMSTNKQFEHLVKNADTALGQMTTPLPNKREDKL